MTAQSSPLSSNVLTVSGVHWKESFSSEKTVTESGVKIGYQAPLVSLPNRIQLMQNIEAWATQYSGYSADLTTPMEGTGLHILGEWAALHSTPTNPRIISGLGYSARSRMLQGDSVKTRERVFQSKAMTGVEWLQSNGGVTTIMVEVPLGTDIVTGWGTVHPKAKPLVKVSTDFPVGKQSTITMIGSYQRWDASDLVGVRINGQSAAIWQPKTTIATLGLQFKMAY